MEPIRPYEIFHKTFQPVNEQIFEYITQRMLIVLKCFKRNVWTVHETHEHTGKIAVQKISITVEAPGAVNTPVIQFQTVYSSERETIKCEMETKNVPGVPDGKYEVFYIANTDEFIYARDPKVSDYMNIIFVSSFVDILYKDITVIVTTLRMHHDSYEHTKEVQKRKMQHRETEDDKCDAAWQQTLLHLSETLRQMNTEHTGVRYETILFGRGRCTPPVLFAYVVHLPNNVLHGVIVIAANLNDDTALELRYYENSSGLLSHDDKNVVMSISHAGVACSGYDEAYQKLCANVGKDHGDKIVGMIQETTGDPIKQKEEVMADKNKWVTKLENIHNKIQKFNDERFTIESHFTEWGDESAQITVYLRDKSDDVGEHFGEIRYTVNENHDSVGAKWNASLTIRYFSNRQDVHWCEPLSIVDANTGQYIVRGEPTVMLKDLGSRWTDKFIGLLKAEEECAMTERTHTIELSAVIIKKGVLPEGCDEQHHIALKIYSVNDDVHKRIFKMYEDCPLELSTDAKRRYMPSRDGNETTVVVFVPDADEINMNKVYDYCSTITLSLDSLLCPGNTLINAVVKHINIPGVGEWDGLPKKQHKEEKCESDKEPVKPTEDKPKTDDKWVRFIEDMARMFKRQSDKPRFKHMKFETELAFRNSQRRCVNPDVKCFMDNDLIGTFTIRLNNRPNDLEERVPVVIRFFPESEGYCEGIYWIDGCSKAVLHINKQTGGEGLFYNDMVRTLGIEFVQFFEQWIKNKLEFINAFDCEEDVDDVPTIDSRITAPREFTLRDVAIHVLPHPQATNPVFIEFAPISEVEKMAILDMYNNTPLDGEEGKRRRFNPEFWQIRGTNTFRVRLCVFFSSFDMLHRLEAARPYERFDVKLSLSKGQINITVESLTFKKMLRGCTNLFDGSTAREGIDRLRRRMIFDSTYGMTSRSFDECVEEIKTLQGISFGSEAAKKLEESINAISANPGETIWIDSLGCNNKTKTHQEVGTMKNTTIDKLFFSGDTTIIMWTDGTKTVVQPMEGEPFDPEVGIAMGIVRKLFGSRHQLTKFVDSKVREKCERESKKLIEKELASLIADAEATIKTAKEKHAAAKKAYDEAVAAGKKKLPKLTGLKSDRNYRYAKIMLSVLTAERDDRKRKADLKKAARAESTKKDAKKPTPAKKPTTKKKKSEE